MMKKIFSFLLMSAMLLAVGASVVSCSSDDEDDGIINEQRVEKYITGYIWYPDYKKQPEFRFYRNRCISCADDRHICRRLYIDIRSCDRSL